MNEKLELNYPLTLKDAKARYDREITQEEESDKVFTLISDLAVTAISGMIDVAALHKAKEVYIADFLIEDLVGRQPDIDLIMRELEQFFSQLGYDAEFNPSDKLLLISGWAGEEAKPFRHNPARSRQIPLDQYSFDLIETTLGRIVFQLICKYLSD